MLFARSAMSVLAIAAAAMSPDADDFRHRQTRQSLRRQAPHDSTQARKRVMIPDMLGRMTRNVRRGYVQPVTIRPERQVLYMHAHARRMVLLSGVLYVDLGRAVPAHGSGP